MDLTVTLNAVVAHTVESALFKELCNSKLKMSELEKFIQDYGVPLPSRARKVDLILVATLIIKNQSNDEFLNIMRSGIIKPRITQH